MTKYITSDEQLRKIIPNAFAQNIPGAQSFFDKILPFIEGAESWIEENITGPSFESSTVIKEKIECLVAVMAYRDALPAIDVVVSHNGVGVVETNTLKPASKAKMDALDKNLTRLVDNYICELISYLQYEEEWSLSPKAGLFMDYILDNPLHVKSFRVPEAIEFRNILERYDFFRPVMTSIQDQIANEWISRDILNLILLFKREARLLTERIKAKFGEYKDCEIQTINEITSLIRQAIFATILRNEGLYDPMFRDIKSPLELAVQKITGCKPLSKIWARTSTARFFKYKGFLNKKDSTAYWF